MGAGSGGGAASKMLVVLAAAGAIGVAGLGGYALSNFIGQGKPLPQAASAPVQVQWVASAPGRVEAKSGEIRIGAAVLGRIMRVTVGVNDRVEAREVLVRLEDDEARARLSAAEAEAGARLRERDAQPASAGREDVRKAEDAVYLAERAVTGARYELDAALLTRRTNGGNDRMVADARKRLSDARERLQREQVSFATAQSRSNVPAPSRLEAALIAARAEVSLAQILFDRTRIRAPIDGTVLQVMGKTGETVAPSPEQPIIVMGDPATIIVKAEIDERDIAKIKIGQRAFVRSTAFPGRDFEGKVTTLAPALGPPRMSQRGPRRPTDVEVLEVTIEFENKGPLMPGLRVDTFFRRES
ncbi:MAG: efflux RND transporter periplasmic adaptor subunit [Hyphomicrobiaceae bacterium]|nr:efflux RND transporter periplasmic adaptor subunit [Hyphomicrobiaceae bacterium]